MSINELYSEYEILGRVANDPLEDEETREAAEREQEEIGAVIRMREAMGGRY